MGVSRRLQHQQALAAPSICLLAGAQESIVAAESRSDVVPFSYLALGEYV